MIIDFENTYTDKKFKKIFGMCQRCHQRARIRKYFEDDAPGVDLASDCHKCGISVWSKKRNNERILHQLVVGWNDGSKPYELYVIPQGIYLCEYNKKPAEVKMFGRCVHQNIRNGTFKCLPISVSGMSIYKLFDVYKNIETLKVLF